MLKYRALSHLDKKSPKTGNIPTDAVSSGPWLYLVEEKKTSKRFVMRKMEVEDETVADLAEKEFNDVIRLTSEKRVVPYKECFVNFSKLDSALYLCLVGEYCPEGSLKALLAEQRGRGTVIGEGGVRKWYGELLEGLEGVHRDQRPHRRVKSSNVFVRDGGLVLGFMGLQTEEGDIKREYSSILPPEYRNKMGSDLSYGFDIWCMGVLLLEMCTNGVISCEDIATAVSKDENEVKRILDVIEEKYNMEIVHVISSCLRSNPINRCTIQYLCSLPFSQDCLSLIRSPLLARIRAEETVNLPTPPSLPYSTQSVFQYMRDNLTIRQCQLIGLEKLLICVNENHEKLNNSEKRFLRNILEEYFPIMLFQLSVVRLFVSCLKELEDNPMEVLLTHPYVDIVCKIVLQQTDATDLLSCCCVYLLLVSHHEDNPTRIANHGLIPHVLKIVSHNSENTVCISLVCSLLWSLTVIPDSLRAMTELNALQWTMDITRRFEEDPTILLAATNLLSSLFQDKINLEKAYYYDIVSICISSLQKYSSTQGICVSTLNVLVVVCGIESCAFQLLVDESSKLIILLEYMKNGISHLSIAERTIALLKELFNFKDLKEELLSLELKEILSNSFEESPFPILNGFIQTLELTNK